MSIEDRANDAPGQLPDAASESSVTSTDRDRDAKQLDSQMNDRVEESDSASPTAVVTIKDKCKELKENLTPSFQEIEAPNTTLASTSTKVEELKSEIEAESEQMFPHRNDNSSEDSSVSGVN
jgi:hypothetical protein